METAVVEREESYISRKKRLLNEVRVLSSSLSKPGEDDPEHYLKSVFFITSKIAGILIKFDLGEEIDDQATEFSVFLESKIQEEHPDLMDIFSKLMHLLCSLYEIVNETRDF